MIDRAYHCDLSGKPDRTSRLKIDNIHSFQSKHSELWKKSVFFTHRSIHLSSTKFTIIINSNTRIREKIQNYIKRQRTCVENSRKIFHFVSCSNLSLDRSILQRQIDIHRRIEDHRFTVGRSRASRKKRRKGVERRWPTGAALLIPRAHGAHHGRARMQRDAHRQVGKKETHAIPFHSRPRALYSTLASKLSPQRRGYISLSLSPYGQDPLRSFLCLEQGAGKRSGRPERVRAYTVLQSASDPPLCGLECLFLSETRSNRSPTRARVHDTRDRALLTGGD